MSKDENKPVIWYQEEIKKINFGYYFNIVERFQNAKHFFLVRNIGEEVEYCVIIQFKNILRANLYSHMLEEKAKYLGNKFGNILENNKIDQNTFQALINEKLNEGWEISGKGSSPNFPKSK